MLAKWRRFLTASDSEFTGFSAEDLRLAEENYARVAQEQIGDISDLDISDFSDDEGKNEDPEHNDPALKSETLAR